MLRVVPHNSAAAALQYYAEGLKREDYYTEGQEIAGKWYGKAAAMLGLEGQVLPKEFAALVENRNPKTGKQLTPRMKADRIVGYDLNFHAPKSLSILHALGGDENIVKAFRKAVLETMQEMETQVTTRVRKGGGSSNRPTGNMVWAEFVHFTARPVGGVPDPHLHVHCFAMNSTFDEVEGRWKAAKFRDIKTDAPYSEAVFHAKLAGELTALGYEIERTKKGWEIKGIPRSLVEKFSRRTEKIERIAEKRGITDPALKDALGAATREGKRKGLSHSDLQAEWKSRLTPEERALISKICGEKGRSHAPKVSVVEAVDYACEKLFAKASVVEQKQLVAAAIKYGVGQLTEKAIWNEFSKRELVTRPVGGRILCTSVDVLAEEVCVINFARTGRKQHAPFLNGEFKPSISTFTAEEKAALRQILTSTDQVILLKGGAGVGKTTLMREVVDTIERSGSRVFAFASSASASRGTLRDKGFGNADTVAHLLANPSLQIKMRGQVIWIDEGATVGIRDLWQIMRIVGNSGRLILTGDSGQHQAVPRGDPFRILPKYAGLKIAEVTQIRRQEAEAYRNAVAALAKGDVRTGLKRLDALGAIIEIADSSERYQLLAEDFAALSRKGSVPLVVSPTHAEGALVTTAIRNSQRQLGNLKGERIFTRLHNLQWEVADRKWAKNYREGLIIQFNQNVTGVKKGEIFKVAGLDEQGGIRLITDAGRKAMLPLGLASRFDVFEERGIQIGEGERVRVTRNARSVDGKKLHNGDAFTVASFGRKGEIVLSNGAVIDPKRVHLAHGYVTTSHAAQSRTVKDVLIAQSAGSAGAASKEQFYVSVSRGSETVRIYTDSRRDLQEAVGYSSTRKAGIELLDLSAQDAASFMSVEATKKEWQEMIKNRHSQAEDAAKEHVKVLVGERRRSVLNEEGKTVWKQYIEMRSQLPSASGRHRAKVGSAPGSRRSQIKDSARGFGRPTQLPSSELKTGEPWNAKTREKLAARPVQKVDPQLSRMAQAQKAAAARFKQVVCKAKGAVSVAREKLLPQSNSLQAARQKMNVRAAQAHTATKKPVKVQAPPPPAPRRGK